MDGRVFLISVSGVDLSLNFFQKENHKTYKKISKKDKAMKTFFENYEANEAHNKRENESYTRSVSSHSDLTLEEKRKLRLGLKSPLRTRSFVPISPNITDNHDVPANGL